MGEKQNQPFQFSFNPSLRVEFQGSRVTSDSGLLLVRELAHDPRYDHPFAMHTTDGETVIGSRIILRNQVASNSIVTVDV